MGSIERFPGGRRPKVPRPSDKGKAVEQERAPMVDGRAKLLAALPRPALVTGEDAGLRVPAEETLEAKLNRITGKSLDLIEQILDMPCAPDNLKLLSIKKDAALSMVSLAAKVNANELRKREVDMMPAMLRRLAEIEKADPKLIDNKPPGKMNETTATVPRNPAG